MGEQEILFKILEQSSQANSRLAVIESKQEDQIKSQRELAEKHEDIAKRHYKLENNFNNHKSRFVWISGVLGSIFGGIATFIWKIITGDNK